MNNPTNTAEQYYAPIIEDLRQQRYAEAERGAVEEIRKAPLVPQGWVLLGEALLHQGFGAAARKAFDRAWLLDPQAEWVPSVQQLLDAAPNGERRSDIDALLGYKKVTVAIGIIARDEERSIARCLSSIRDAADEIVLVDCGSVDRTVEIASGFDNVTIVHAEWNNDFAALRNVGLARMRSDWVLWIDADEHLHPDDITAVREVAALYDDFAIPPVLYVWQVNEVAGTVVHEFSQTRMFPLRYGLKYYGRVHEQVGPASGRLYTEPSYRKPVRIRLLHDGYEPEIMKSKAKLARNLALLAMMVEEEPDNPGWWTYYARESLASGLVDQALDALTKATAAAADKPAFARMLDVHMLTAKIRASRKEWELVEQACAQALALHSDYPDAHFYLAMARLKRGNELYRQADASLRKAKEGFATYRGTVSPDHDIARWKADATLADIARATGKLGEAGQVYMEVFKRNPHVAELRKPLELLKQQKALLDSLLGERT